MEVCRRGRVCAIGVVDGGVGDSWLVWRGKCVGFCVGWGWVRMCECVSVLSGGCVLR